MSEEEAPLVSFRAIFPAIQSAIRIAGDGGMRIQLDVPESEMMEAIRLAGLRDEVLIVKVWVEDV